jgi:hypothetical protein
LILKLNLPPPIGFLFRMEFLVNHLNGKVFILNLAKDRLRFPTKPL